MLVIVLTSCGCEESGKEKLANGADDCFYIGFILVLLIMGIFPGLGSTSTQFVMSRGQRVYVPVYSHIY